MLWEIEIQPRWIDVEKRRVQSEYALLTQQPPGNWIKETRRGYLIEGPISHEQSELLLRKLLVDDLVESARFGSLNQNYRQDTLATVLLKPGVMDPVALSIVDAAADIGIRVETVRSFRRYFGPPPDSATQKLLFSRILANDAIEQVIAGPLHLDHLSLGSRYSFERIENPLRNLDEKGLEKLSRDGLLALNLEEMKAVQKHFVDLGREPTDVELETIAQTWSEHCSHKTLKGEIEFEGRLIQNLLKETIFGATQQIRQKMGSKDWCVSVFEDNAGVVQFDENYHVCFKVETHNHPSAIEPYGGANTGLGGVIRDPLGTGLGAKPIASTDIFCFAPPDTSLDRLPPGILHPKKIINGVVSGVRDYGNRMGIPTINGAVCFDDRYLANPLVYCGTVGIIPVDRSQKSIRAGDLIVAVGGRTGRDGIHGATFSSIELTAESEHVSGGAVQIGNAIAQKKMLDVILQARDQGLYRAITDCGAGGFSSAVGEMGEKLGAHVDLDRAPLKYSGLSYTEIWISESQERMILAVPPENLQQLQQLFQGENVETAVLGHFEDTGMLRLFYQGNPVANLSMNFLHHGQPRVVRKATRPVPSKASADIHFPAEENYTSTLHRLLGSLNVCSKEWIIRQYDHEVQGGSVIKPLVGIHEDGPEDASVVTPVLGSHRGIALGVGLNPHYGDHDCYTMALAAVDEAVRNLVAVGADPDRIALLDNFCWGNTDRPETLGSLVLAAQGCRDASLALNMPFISGKDSLKNEYHSGHRHIIIPPTLLISAMGQVPDVRRCVTMDLKKPGNAIYLVGNTHSEFGGSHYGLIHGINAGNPPRTDLTQAPSIFRGIYHSIQKGLIRSCHDLSEGGLAVAIAEMAFSGGVGAKLVLPSTPGLQDPDWLFSESTTRFIVEVETNKKADFLKAMEGLPVHFLGSTVPQLQLSIQNASGKLLIESELSSLKESWQKPLRW